MKADSPGGQFLMWTVGVLAGIIVKAIIPGFWGILAGIVVCIVVAFTFSSIFLDQYEFKGFYKSGLISRKMDEQKRDAETTSEERELFSLLKRIPISRWEISPNTITAKADSGSDVIVRSIVRTFGSYDDETRITFYTLTIDGNQVFERKEQSSPVHPSSIQSFYAKTRKPVDKKAAEVACVESERRSEFARQQKEDEARKEREKKNDLISRLR